MAREMKDSGIKWLGAIPDRWKIKKIKYTLQERVEKNNPIRTDEILSLTAKQGVIPYSEKEGGGNKPKEDLSAYRLAYPGDIVMNSMNILSGSVGLSSYFGCVSPVYYMLRPYNKNEDVRYYNYIFQTTVFQRSLFGLGNGILIKESGNGKLNTIRMRIPMDKFGELLIPIAPVEEQQKIADYLDKKCAEIDSLITDIQSQIDILEDYKKSVITEAVTKGLNPDVEMKDSGIDYLGNVNPNWKITKIGYICRKLNHSFNSDAEVLICSNKGEVFLRGNTNFGLTSDNDSMFQGVKSGELLIHGMDTWHGAIAISKYNGKCTKVVHVCESDENKNFICYFLQMLAFKKVYKAISNGVRENTSDFRSWDKTGAIYISIPDKKEQDKISAYLEEKCNEINIIIETKKEQLDILEQYKKSLIYEYVTGKKEVK